MFLPPRKRDTTPAHSGFKAFVKSDDIVINSRIFRRLFDLLLRHGFWTDASYVAARVLTIEGLRAYVDQHWPVGVTAGNPTGAAADQPGWADETYQPRLAATIRDEGARWGDVIRKQGIKID